MKIAASSLKGYILEETLAFLIRNVGYRLLADAVEDAYELRKAPHGLTVRGRGWWHQADVLGELIWNPAFTHPIRLFVEAKWRGVRPPRGDGLEERDPQRVGIDVVRQAVGIVEDLRQNITMTRVSDPCVAEDCPAELEYRGRTRRYDYRYAIFSTSGFTKDAVRYALAHQVSLIDLSLPHFNDLRRVIDQVGNQVFRQLEHFTAQGAPLDNEADDDGEPGRATSGRIIETVRFALRELLYRNMDRFPYQYVNKRRSLLPVVRDALRPLQEVADGYGEVFVGMAAGGVMIVLIADSEGDRHAFIRALNRRPTIEIEIYYERDGRGKVERTWRIVPSGDRGGDEQFQLSFRVPDMIFDHIRDNDTAPDVLASKSLYFSQITVYRVDGRNTVMGLLSLSRGWYRRAKQQIDEEERQQKRRQSRRRRGP
ncbi:hypothetical protein [Azospirillum brasilense]|uniref:hypothetical protein n=1 Tax=Azospirillum brasilense TaxID=192 RepID=UPI0011C483AB|nr:hypothetical protein [Azospirillum brasilense]NUB25305.1 hypothetical protein [Azospirillum brasilense]NUB33623.1 hypothetical protein [Azospirillum brasilense]